MHYRLWMEPSEPSTTLSLCKTNHQYYCFIRSTFAAPPALDGRRLKITHPDFFRYIFKNFSELKGSRPTTGENNYPNLLQRVVQWLFILPCTNGAGIQFSPRAVCVWVRVRLRLYMYFPPSYFHIYSVVRMFLFMPRAANNKHLTKRKSALLVF